MDDEFKTNTHYWRWRYTQGESAGDQLQQAIQAYIKLYRQRPSLVLIPAGLKLASPMSGLDLQEDESVPPFRFYFAAPKADVDNEDVPPD